MRMMMTFMAALGLAGCVQSNSYDADRGVGFQDYQGYLRQREAALNGQQEPMGQQPYGAAPTGFSPERIGSAIDAASGGVPGSVQPAQQQYGNQLGGGQGAVIGSDPNRPRGDAPMGIASVDSEVNPNNAGISDEQDFSAVTSRETIASDAERIARNRDQYQVIQPGALPTRDSSSAGSNVVKFAMSTSHNPGTAMYKRSAIGLSNPERACGRYTSPDKAQEAFLAAGGPEKDRKGLDPDGDGYACSWDPRPFRAN